MSRIIVDAIRNSSASTDGITLASNGSVTIPNLTATSLTTNSTFGKVKQVVYFNKTDASSMSMTETWTDVTGYSLSITPTASNSKIILQGQVNYNCNDHYTYGKFVRSINGGAYADVTDWIGDTASVRVRSMTGSMKDYDSYRNAPMAIYAVDDTHNTTDTITYKLQFRGSYNHLTIVGYFNRSETDSDNNNGGRAVSHLTLMEVAA